MRSILEIVLYFRPTQIIQGINIQILIFSSHHKAKSFCLNHFYAEQLRRFDYLSVL